MRSRDSRWASAAGTGPLAESSAKAGRGTLDRMTMSIRSRNDVRSGVKGYPHFKKGILILPSLATFLINLPDFSILRPTPYRLQHPHSSTCQRSPLSTSNAVSQPPSQHPVSARTIEDFLRRGLSLTPVPLRSQWLCPQRNRACGSKFLTTYSCSLKLVFGPARPERNNSFVSGT